MAKVSFEGRLAVTHFVYELDIGEVAKIQRVRNRLGCHRYITGSVDLLELRPSEFGAADWAPDKPGVDELCAWHTVLAQNWEGILVVALVTIRERDTYRFGRQFCALAQVAVKLVEGDEVDMVP